MLRHGAGRHGRQRRRVELGRLVVLLLVLGMAAAVAVGLLLVLGMASSAATVGLLLQLGQGTTIAAGGRRRAAVQREWTRGHVGGCAGEGGGRSRGVVSSSLPYGACQLWADLLLLLLLLLLLFHFWPHVDGQ